MTCPSFSPHDHAACTRTALADAEARCRSENLRLTPARRRVLELLLQAPKAQGAYDILGRLAQGGRRAQPPSVYRALEFLVDHGFAHRLEKRNAFVACAHPGHPHMPGFLICRACDRVVETADTASRRLDRAAEAAGFVIERRVVEASGLCPACVRQ